MYIQIGIKISERVKAMLSVIIPSYNEEENIENTAGVVTRILDENSIDFYAKNLLDVLVHLNKNRTITSEIPIKKLYDGELKEDLRSHIKAL